MKKLFFLSLFVCLLTKAMASCTNGTQYSGTVYPGPVFGSTIITNGTTTCINSGQYFKIGTSAGVFYQVNSSISTDYVTITDLNGFLIGEGPQPLIYQTNTVMTVRVYIHESNSCFYDNLCRAISVSTAAVVPALNTYPSATQIAATTATCGGLITSNGSSTPTAFGVCYSINPNPTVNDFVKPGTSTGSGYFTSNMTGLSPNTTYYLRAYATNSAGTGYGSEIVFTTAPIGCIATAQSPAFTVSSSNTVGQLNTIGGCIYAGTYAKVNFYAGDYTINSSITTDFFTVTDQNNVVLFKGQQPLSISLPTGNLLRVHIANDSLCGSQSTCRLVTFVRNTTVASPQLITTAVNSIAISSAKAGGYISNAGGSAVTARGLCYSTTEYPTISGSTLPAGSGTGVFSVSLSGLNSATKYYLRAYATNSTGTSYGQQVSFTTATAILATVNTAVVSQVTDSTAHTGGSVLAAGSLPVTAKGVCFSTNLNPTTSDFVVSGGSGLGSFTSNLTGLAPGTTYHVRAFATSGVGTAYGIDRVFTTTAPILPTVTTTAVSLLTSNSASSGGDISSAGGSSVSSRGVCYGLASGPTLADNIVSGGSGIGTFTSNLTGLLPSTTYYVRAFATNNTGTAYGNEITFTTTSPNAIIETQSYADYSLSPNPFNDLLHIRLFGKKTMSFKLYNCLGEPVMSREIESSSTSISLPNLPSGLYFVELDGRIREKLIKN